MQAAISEKDATIALLEMTSTKKQRNLEEIERLTHEKHRLQTSLREVVSSSWCAVTWGSCAEYSSTVTWGGCTEYSSTVTWGSCAEYSSTVTWGSCTEYSSTVTWGSCAEYSSNGVLSLWAVVESAAVSAVTLEESDKSAIVYSHLGKLYGAQLAHQPQKKQSFSGVVKYVSSTAVSDVGKVGYSAAVSGAFLPGKIV